MKKLIAARATVHIISYTEFVRQKNEDKPSIVVAGPRATIPIRSGPRIRPNRREQHDSLLTAYDHVSIRR